MTKQIGVQHTWIILSQKFHEASFIFLCTRKLYVVHAVYGYVHLIHAYYSKFSHITQCTFIMYDVINVYLSHTDVVITIILV